MRLRIAAYFAVLIFNTISGLIETMILPSAEQFIRAATAGLDVLMVLLAGSVLWRTRRFYGTILLAVFVLSAVITMTYNYERFGIVAQLNGLRTPLFYFSCLIVAHDFFQSSYRQRFIRYFTVFLFLFAIAQIPLTVVQFLRYGAGDQVGGTFGTGGGSGVVTQLLFVVVAYFLVRYGSLEGGVGFSLTRLSGILVLLLPVFLNETKITFVLLGMLTVLVAFSRRRALMTIPLLMVGASVFVVFAYYYGEVVGNPWEIFTEKFITDYLYGAPKEQYGEDLPRLLRVSLMFHVFRQDALSIVLGIGYGIFGGGTLLGVARFARSLYYLTTGSRILLVTIWLQGGILALLIMIAAVFGFLRSRLDMTWTLRRFKWFVAGSLALVWIYNDAILERTFAGIMTFLMTWIAHGGLDGEKAAEGEVGQDEIGGFESASAGNG